MQEARREIWERWLIMIVSHKFKFALLEPKKTGTSSLRSLLTTNSNVVHDSHIGDLIRRHDGLDNMSPEIEGMIKGYHIVSTRRNPWARLVSFYHFHKDIVKFDRLANQLSFLDWLEKFSVSDQIESCWHKGCDKNGTQLVNQFIRTEHLQADLNVMCDNVGMRRMKLERLNKSDHIHYSHYYNDEARDRAAEVYADDIEHFGYKFEDRRD